MKSHDGSASVVAGAVLLSLPTTLVASMQNVLVPEEPGPTGVATVVYEGFGAVDVGAAMVGEYVKL